MPGSQSGTASGFPFCIILKQLSFPGSIGHYQPSAMETDVICDRFPPYGGPREKKIWTSWMEYSL